MKKNMFILYTYTCIGISRSKFQEVAAVSPCTWIIHKSNAPKMKERKKLGRF